MRIGWGRIDEKGKERVGVRVAEEGRGESGGGRGGKGSGSERGRGK